MSSPKVILITGGNNGIGYEAVKAFLHSEKAYHILLGSRTLEKAKRAIENLSKDSPGRASNKIEPVEIDLNSDESIQKAFEQVKASPGHIDVLVNNAGAAFDKDFLSGDISLRECFLKAYDCNVAGTHVLTYTFMPLVLTSSDPRLVFVSGLSNITRASEHFFPTPPQPAGWPKSIAFETIGYRCSKMALNMLMVDWNHKLKADGVKVWGVAPGLLETDLGGQRDMAKKMKAGHPSTGAKLIQMVVEGDKDEYVGKLVNLDGVIPF